MLKTLKWIYQLGYKHAEERYYNSLMRHADFNNDPFISQYHQDPKEREEYEQREKEIIHRVERIIEEVFHPEVFIEPERPQTKNRFEP